MTFNSSTNFAEVFGVLLEQHDNYDLGDDVSIEKRSDCKWVVYVGPMHIDGYSGGAEVVFHMTVASAILYIASPAGQRAVKAAREKFLERYAGVTR